MITIRIKTIEWSDTGTSILNFNNTEDFYNFCRTVSLHDSPPSRVLVEVKTPIGDREFITCDRYLGKSVLKHVKDLITNYYIYDILTRN